MMGDGRREWILLRISLPVSKCSCTSLRGEVQAVMLASDSVDNLPIQEVHNKFSCSLMSY